MRKTFKKIGRVFNLSRESSRSRPSSPARDRDTALVSSVHLPLDSHVISEPQSSHVISEPQSSQVNDVQQTGFIRPPEICIMPSTTPPDRDPISSVGPSEHRLLPITSRAMPDTARLPLTPHDSRIPLLSIVSNNQNTTYNYGGTVVNYNPVNIKIRLTKEVENVVKTIRTAIGDRFVPSAMYDVPSKEPGCMPGTRLSVLSKFLKWAKEDLMGIYWLAGLAGTGKTSIAVTLFRVLQDEPSLRFGGAFFCSRTANTAEFMDVRRILPTIAVALAEVYPEFAAALAAELETDPHAALKDVSSQIVSLLQKPLNSLATSVRPIVFVIDALDECSDMNQVEQLLRALSALTCAAKVKFVVTSRPDMHINTSLAPTHPNAILRLHTIDAAEVKEDIRLYIHDRFSKQPQSEEWYTESHAISLATSADGLFIFASTVIAYVLDRPSASPDYRRARLQKAMHAMKTTKVANAPLDAMYSFVLGQASDSDTVEPEELDATKKGLACILTARMPLSITALSEILEQEPDTLRTSLLLLTALVHVPDDVDEPVLRTVHASFGDYLFERAPDHLRITAALGNEALARGSLRVMRERLCFNISQSRSSYEPNSPSKPDSITLSLEYACLHWAYHIADLQQPQMLDSEINDNFCPNFLFWLEVMSILGQVPRSTAMLFIAVAKVESTELRRFLTDANGFVVSFREAIERSTPHIYLSALPHVPEHSLIHKHFIPSCTGLVSIDAFGIEHLTGGVSLTLTGHTKAVTAVAYNPDGHLVSGSFDGTVRIWNTHTGGEVMPNLQSGGIIRCIDVAPTGTSLAAGMESGTVCIWDLQAPQRPPQRYYGRRPKPIESVAFSPCGHLIASASTDRFVRLRKAETGEQVSAMFHEATVYCVTFSPDGETLASGGYGCGVHLWKGRTGKPATVPVLHPDGWVSSLRFAPDATRIAAGLTNSEIILWEMSTATRVARLRVNAGLIQSVQFSRDGTSLLCCSEDNAFQLYSLDTDAIDSSPAVFVGHSGTVRCATFSRDGLYIASASDDHTIRIWNAGDGKRESRTARTDKDPVGSVHVSADGTFIVSSHHRSVRVWDSQTGELKLSILIENEYRILSTAMFPPDRYVEDLDDSLTLRLFDARTGEEIDGPPQNHTSDIIVIVTAPDGHYYSSTAEYVKLWDATTRQRSSIPLPCRSDVRPTAFSPDGQLIAVSANKHAASATRQTYIWRADTGQPVCAPFPNLERVKAFSHDNTRIACSGEEGSGAVWDIRTGNRIINLEGHSNDIYSIVFAPDDLKIATGSEDCTVRLWDAATGAQLAVLHGHGSNVRSVTFTPNGRFIVSGSDDSTIRVWNVESALMRSISGLDPAMAAESPRSNDGWLLGPKGELLLWVLDEYRDYIKGPGCRLVMPGHVSIGAPEIRHHGTKWVACWLGPVSA